MYDAALLFATALAELDRSQVGLMMQYQTWIKWTKPSITTHYILQFRVPTEQLSYSFNNRWCVCRRLTLWFWVVIQRRHGNMETHWSTIWNWWVIIICRWKVILLWPTSIYEQSLLTKMTPLSLFIICFYFPPKLLSFAEKFLLNKIVPDLQLEMKTFSYCERHI